jgi:hypothetical protein
VGVVSIVAILRPGVDDRAAAVCVRDRSRLVDRPVALLRYRETKEAPFRFPERGPFGSSPDGIRTRATALRGRRPRPLDDGATAWKRWTFPLGYQDSNLD